MTPALRLILDQLQNALKGLLLLLANLRSQTPQNAPQAPQQPQTAPTPSTPAPVSPAPAQAQTDVLTRMCLLTKEFEGWGGPRSTINGVLYPDGTPSYRNNNPGNCRYSSVGYDQRYGVAKRSSTGFAQFRDYQTGWEYLQNLVREKINAHPTWTLRQFFGDPKDGYSPAKDGNDPVAYGNWVAARLSVDPATFQIGLVLA